MSAEKLSPRQQMIGMMYLVLTAMLALNVSSSVLDKYVVINASLERTAKKNLEYCDVKVKQIEKGVSDNGNKEKDIKNLEIAKESYVKTKEVCQKLTKMKSDMVELTGGYEKNNSAKPKDAKNDGIVVRYMIKDENANQLKDLVNNHLKYLSGLSNLKFNPIALDADNDPFYRDDANQSGKPYAILHFGDHVPLVAAMATISEYQATLVSACSDVIDTIQGSIGADMLKFDTFKPMLNADSNMVVAGMNYKADLYLGASSSAVVPEMFINGQKISVSNDGVGVVSLPTPKNLKFDSNGIAIQKINANIKQVNPTTGDVVEVNKVFEYKIVKPTLDVQAVSVSTLYRNCGNEMVIKCAALGPNYSPTFKVTGGKVIKGNSKEQVTIIPSPDNKGKDAKVNIEVFNEGTSLGTLSYAVKSVPNPEVAVLVNNKLVDERKGVNPDVIKNVTIRVKPEENFGSFLPNDANYKVVKWTVTACKGINSLFSKDVNDQNTLTISGNEKMMLYQADRLLIEIKDIVRINCEKEEEHVFKKGECVIKNIPISSTIS